MDGKHRGSEQLEDLLQGVPTPAGGETEPSIFTPPLPALLRKHIQKEEAAYDEMEARWEKYQEKVRVEQLERIIGEVNGKLQACLESKTFSTLHSRGTLFDPTNYKRPEAKLLISLRDSYRSVLPALKLFYEEQGFKASFEQEAEPTVCSFTLSWEEEGTAEA